MIQSYAGVVRDIDLERGHIDHAIAVIAPAAVLKPAFVFPALAFDSDSSPYRGTLPMGTRLALPRDAPRRSARRSAGWWPMPHANTG